MIVQINRLFEIVYLLLNHKTFTAKELSQRFEVSARTILRDVEALSAAGIPIYTSRGKGGGIAILDHYVLNKAAISDEEQNQILFALQSLASTQHLDTGEILSKLRTLFDKTDTHWIEVDFSRWGYTKPDQEKFETLKGAIIQRRSISFTYPSSYGEITNRTVYPLKLVFKAKTWYLQAYCLQREDYRTFRMNRMLCVQVLPDAFDGARFSPPPIEPSDPPCSPLVPLTIRFSSQVAFRVYDEFDLEDVAKNEDGSLTVRVNLPDDDWLYGFLLSFGTAVRVLGPQNVKENFLAKIEKIKEFYREAIT